MPTPRQEPQGFFMSGLDFLDRLSQPIKNSLVGNWGGAGRQTLDLLGDIPDALLPGDWIDHVSRPEDFVTPTDVLAHYGADINPETDPWTSRIADFVGDVGLNPSTYVPGSWIAKGLGGVGSIAAKGAALLPEAAQPTVAAAKNFGAEASQFIRRLGGSPSLTKENRMAQDAAEAAGSNVRDSQGGAIATLFDGANDREKFAVGEIMHGMFADPATNRPLDLIGPRGLGSPGFTPLTPMERADIYLKNPPPGVNPDRVRAMVEQYSSTLSPKQLAEAQSAEQGGHVFYGGPGNKDYFPRDFTVPEEPVLPGARTGQGGLRSEKARKIGSNEDAFQFLVDNPDVTLNFNAADVLSNRAAQSSRLAEKGSIGNHVWNAMKSGDIPLPKSLEDELASGIPSAEQNAMHSEFTGVQTPDEAGQMSWIDDKPTPAMRTLETAKDEYFSKPFSVADPEQNAVVKKAITEYAKVAPEDAQVIDSLYNGLAPRGPVTSMLATAAKPFKKFAVYGFALPKIATDVSNAISGVAQVAMNKEARGHTLKAAADLLPTIWGAVNDGIEKWFGVRFGHNEFAQLEHAARNSGGDVAGMLSQIKDPMMRLAQQHNIFGDNMVTSEQMISAAAKTGWKKVFQNIYDMPAVVFKGVEQRMRYGLFKGLMEKKAPEIAAGKLTEAAAAADAARIAGDTFYNYRVSSVANRNARDIIPFFQFQAKAIPQSAKFFAEKPAAAVALAQLAGAGNDDEMYSYMQGRLNLPIGKDEQGNDQYISGFRLPFESLNSIPNPSADLNQFGKQVRQQVVGASSPLLKTAFSAVSGIDPYFGTPYGSYDKIPLVGHAGKAGQYYNKLAGTGLIQAGVSPLSYINQALDERHSLPVRALDVLTGVNVVSVDPDLALQQQLQNTLETNPDVRQFRSFYQTQGDPENDAIIHAFQEAKKRLKQKRDAEAKSAAP